MKPAAPLTFTLYPHASASAAEARTVTADELRALVEAPTAAPDTKEGKLRQPLLFCGPLAGHVRKDQDPEHISALIVEHDAGAGATNPRHMPFEEARRLLEASGIRAWLFSTWSHEDGTAKGGPRWRVIFPLDIPAPMARLVEFAETVNHILDGVLAKESTQGRRGWFIGARAGRYRAFAAIEGEALDTAALFSDLPRQPLPAAPATTGVNQSPQGDGAEVEPLILTREQLVEAAQHITLETCRNVLERPDASAGECWRDCVLLPLRNAAYWHPDRADDLREAFDIASQQLPGDTSGNATQWAARTKPTGRNPRTIGAFLRACGGCAPTADGFAEVPDAPIDRSSRDAFFYYAPGGTFIDRTTREHWPATSVDSSAKWEARTVRNEDGAEKEVRTPPSKWLRKHRAVHQLSWLPGAGEVADGVVIMEAGEVPHPGNRVFNLYRPPAAMDGDAQQAGKWLEHLRMIYPDDADHLLNWMAYHVQQPAGKCNHAIVLIGSPGIGKDTILEPLVHGVGPWNFADIKPGQLVARFNGFRRSKIVRVNEAHDTGDEITRHGMYEAAKVLIAAPPEVLMVDEKHRKEYAIPNKCGVIFTSNHPTDAMHLASDDRRHYVAASKANKEMFTADYWASLWAWYHAGGFGHAVAYLHNLDITTFNPKAPPPLTAAFWTLVSAGESPDDGDLRDLIAAAGSPMVLTLDDLIEKADHRMAEEMRSPGKRRALQHRLGRAGYLPVRNPGTTDGRWKIGGKNCAVYGQQGGTFAQQCAAIQDKAQKVLEVRDAPHLIF